jgi:hypothetical protein
LRKPALRQFLIFLSNAGEWDKRNDEAYFAGFRDGSDQCTVEVKESNFNVKVDASTKLSDAKLQIKGFGLITVTEVPGQ